MNASKLAKQLKKELTRNTKKTVALGLVTLVALWFWAPLVIKWFGGNSNKKPKAVAAAVETPVAVSADPATEATAPKALPTIAWNLLIDHIAKDELMATATLPASARDPFALTAMEQQEVAASTPAAVPDASGVVTATVRVDATPGELGLKLEATLVTGRSRRSVISGKTYREGDVVRIASVANPAAGTSATTEAIEFVVKSVEQARVVLVRNDKEYPLVLKRESLEGDDQLTVGALTQPIATP